MTSRETAPGDRHETAIRIDTVDDMRQLAHALDEAIEEVGHDRLRAADDPAIRLIIARMAEVVGIASRDEARAAARTACLSVRRKAAQAPMLLQIMARPIAYDEERKRAFHREGQRLLREVAKALRLDRESFEIRSNKAGPAVSGEITLHSDTFYVQLSEGISRGAEILYRTCKGRRDFTGGANHFAPAQGLCDPAAFAAKIDRDLRLSIAAPAVTGRPSLFAA